MAKNASIDWVTHLEFDWEYVTIMSGKIGELLWPTPQPFMQNGELCLICYSPFGPKGAWILNTCQHMYHPQCLITLMVARRRCPQCRALFHWRLYEQLSLRMIMSQHWEYNMFDTPNRPQAWDVDLESWHACYFMEESIWWMIIWQIHDSEGMWIVVLMNNWYTTPLVLSNVLGVV